MLVIRHLVDIPACCFGDSDTHQAVSLLHPVGPQAHIVHHSERYNPRQRPSSVVSREWGFYRGVQEMRSHRDEETAHNSRDQAHVDEQRSNRLDQVGMGTIPGLIRPVLSLGEKLSDFSEFLFRRPLQILLRWDAETPPDEPQAFHGWAHGPDAA